MVIFFNECAVLFPTPFIWLNKWLGGVFCRLCRRLQRLLQSANSDFVVLFDGDFTCKSSINAHCFILSTTPRKSSKDFSDWNTIQTLRFGKSELSGSVMRFVNWLSSLRGSFRCTARFKEIQGLSEAFRLSRCRILGRCSSFVHDRRPVIKAHKVPAFLFRTTISNIHKKIKSKDSPSKRLKHLALIFFRFSSSKFSVGQNKDIDRLRFPIWILTE